MTIKVFTLCFNEDQAFIILDALEQQRNQLRDWLEAQEPDSPDYNEGGVEFGWDQFHELHKQCQALAQQLQLDTSARYTQSTPPSSACLRSLDSVIN